MNLNILLFLVIILIIILLNIQCNKEYFNTGNALISDNQLNVATSLLVSTNSMADLIDNIKLTNKINGNIIGINKQLTVIIDPYINYYVLNNKVESEKYKPGIFVCLSTIRLGISKCIWDMRKKALAYVSMTDYLFIQAFLKAYRQDISKITLIKLSTDDLKSGSVKFDYLFTYVVIDSNYMSFLKEQKYFINGFDDVDIHRIKPFYPFINEYYGNIRELFNKNPNDRKYDVYLSNKQTLIPAMSLDIVKSVENFITRLKMPDDYLEAVDKNYDKANNVGNYGCYGNDKVTNKFECDSLYKYDGSNKDYYSKWDKKCSQNEECPYYKANKNYPNDRGGCNDGFCELPVGVKRVGFKKYIDTDVNRPLCYNCSDTTSYDCCANIEDNNGNTDYVFENDFSDRNKNELNTIISLLNYRESYNNYE